MNKLIFLFVSLCFTRIFAFEYIMVDNCVIKKSSDVLVCSLDSQIERNLSSICVIGNLESDGFMELLKKWWYTDGQSSAADFWSKIDGFGTGFFITPYGHLITNKHVVTSSNPIVFLSEGNLLHPLKASIIATHPTEDICLLKIDEIHRAQFSWINLSPSPLEIGEWTIALRARGVCLDSNHLLILPCMGKVVGRVEDGPDIIVSLSAVPGNSGSPLLNLEGKAVGILSKIALTEQKENKKYGVGITLILPLDKFKDWIAEALTSSGYSWNFE